MDDIEPRVLNPFYAGVACPLQHNGLMTLDMAAGIADAQLHLPKEEQKRLLTEILEGAEKIECPLCRCKAFLFARVLALTCDKEQLPAIREQIDSIDLSRDRPLAELETEILDYMRPLFPETMLCYFYQERSE